VDVRYISLRAKMHEGDLKSEQLLGNCWSSQR